MRGRRSKRKLRTTHNSQLTTHNSQLVTYNTSNMTKSKDLLNLTGDQASDNQPGDSTLHTETEGRAKDLRAYIKLNKKIAAPSSFLTKEFLKGFPPGSAGLNKASYFYELYYIDKDNNLAKVKIDSNDIIDPAAASYVRDRSRLESDLRKIGLKLDSNIALQAFRDVANDYNERIFQENRTKADREFDL